jgi:proline iminopeptidase
MLVTGPDGSQLWTHVTGDGPLTILLSSGGPGCHDYLARLGTLLAAEGRRIVRWEQRGIGRSGGNREGPFTIEDCLADMQSIRTVYGGERWLLAGHSWGADLSLLYALAYPDACTGLLCLAGGRLNNDRAWHAAYDRAKHYEAAAELAYNSTANRHLNEDCQRHLRRPTLYRDVAALTMPALFLYGEDDVRPSWPVEQIAALMPHARFVPVARAGHSLYLTHPGVVHEHSSAFLGALES